MAEPAVSTDALSPLSVKSVSVILEEEVRMKSRKKLSDDFRLYEIIVMFITQLSYIPIAATMLSTTFFEPSVEYCNNRNETQVMDSKNEFRSLLFDWNIVCSSSSIVTILSMVLMSGALAGAFIAGWLADLYGRQPVLKGCLLTVFIGNVVIFFIAHYSIFITSCLFFLLGSACGGYMVVNLVLFVECLELPLSRLFAVSANGWSISMVAVALIAFLTTTWKYFHLITATLALIAYIACSIALVESCRWLDSAQKTEDAYRAAVYIAKKNNYKVHLEQSWWEILHFSPSAAHDVNNDENSNSSNKNYNYLDLFRFSSVYIPLLALTYCFIASSVVSFGFYYFLDVLPGNRYINMALMGFSKFVMGWIPFFASPWMGRRPIVAVSVGIATLAAWLACISLFLRISQLHFLQVALSLIISASLDPTWKILHLYSTELFPTAVRTQARALCNIAARLGSVIAPAAVYLRTVHPLFPLTIFTVLLTLQLIAVLLFLPETKNQPLPSTFTSNTLTVDRALCDG